MAVISRVLAKEKKQFNFLCLLYYNMLDSVSAKVIPWSSVDFKILTEI